MVPAYSTHILRMQLFFIFFIAAVRADWVFLYYLFGPADDDDDGDGDSFGPSFLDTEDDCGPF